MKLGQKSVKNLVGFLGDLKTPKFHSEINWPLVDTKQPTEAGWSVFNPEQLIYRLNCQGFLKFLLGWQNQIYHKLEILGIKRGLTTQNSRQTWSSRRYVSKGQIISMWCLKFSKNSTKLLLRIPTLASKMAQIKKTKAFYYITWYIITNLHDNVPLSFWFDQF